MSLTTTCKRTCGHADEYVRILKPHLALALVFDAYDLARAIEVPGVAPGHISHNYTGHNYIGHRYIGHNCSWRRLNLRLGWGISAGHSKAPRSNGCNREVSNLLRFRFSFANFPNKSCRSKSALAAQCHVMRSQNGLNQN